MKKLWLLLIIIAPAYSMPDIKDDFFKTKPKEKIIKEKYFSHTSEVGLNNANGNSQYQSYNLMTKNIYRYQRQVLVFGGHYNYGEANGVLNSQNWDVNVNYFFKIKPNFATVLGETVEGNKFQELRHRYNSDFGLKYYFKQNQNQKLNLQIGYRYSYEDFYKETPSLTQHKGRALLEWKLKPSKNLEFKILADYIPNFSNGNDWQAGGEVSLSNKINSIFSLKMSYKYMHDNQPANPELAKFDGLTTTSLVAEFD